MNKETKKARKEISEADRERTKKAIQAKAKKEAK